MLEVLIRQGCSLSLVRWGISIAIRGFNKGSNQWVKVWVFGVVSVECLVGGQYEVVGCDCQAYISRIICMMLASLGICLRVLANANALQDSARASERQELNCGDPWFILYAFANFMYGIFATSS